LSFLEGVKQLADFYSSKKIRGNHIIAHNNFNNTPDKIKNCNKRIANYCFCELSYFKPNGPYNNWHGYKDTDIIYYRKDNVKPNLRLRFSYSGGITFGVIGGEGAIGPSTISEKGGLYLKIENSKVKICNFNETLFEHSAAIDINKQTKIVWRPDGLEVNGVKDVFVASAKDVFFKENPIKEDTLEDEFIGQTAVVDEVIHPDKPGKVLFKGSILDFLALSLSSASLIYLVSLES
jgi:hypothetical protein